jgi:hypothetical protein
MKEDLNIFQSSNLAVRLNQRQDWKMLFLPAFETFLLYKLLHNAMGLKSRGTICSAASALKGGVKPSFHLLLSSLF